MARNFDEKQIENVQNIFNSMEYGNPTDNEAIVKEWINQHANPIFGGFKDNDYLTTNSSLKDCSTFEFRNSSNGEKIAQFYRPDQFLEAIQLESFLETVRNGKTADWANLSGHQRAKYLYSAARNAQKHQRLLSVLESVTSGRHIASTTDIDIPNLIRAIYQSASVAQLQTNSASDKGVVVISATEVPSPIVSLCWKFLPLLALGYRLLFALAPECSLTAFLFAEICRTSGFPNDALTVLIADPSGQLRIANSGPFHKIFFQGETSIGKTLIQAAGSFLTPVQCSANKRLTAIVFESADQQSAIDSVIYAAHSGIGTRHGCRLLVQESIYSNFVGELKAKFAMLRVGWWNDKCADLTSVITETTKLDQLLTAIQEAETENANVIRSEMTYPVYLIDGAQCASRIVQEQTMGVVITLLPFRTVKESVAIANSAPGCDTAAIWSERVTVALEVGKSIKANPIWINGQNHYDEPIQKIQNLETNLHKRSATPIKNTDTEFGVNTTCLKKKFLPVSSNSTGKSSTVDKTYKLYYGGGQKRPDGNTSYPVLDPTGHLIAFAPEATKKDVRNAVEVAQAAQSSWHQRSGHNKAQLAFYLAENLEQRKIEFSDLLCQLTGQSKINSDQEVNETIQCLFKMAALADKNAGDVLNTPLNGLVVSIREPLGVIGIICPKEKPLLSFVSLAIGAACHGNTVVAISNQDQPLAALNLYQVLDTSDWPGGVINILSGATDHLTKILTQHNGVKGLWYFGQSETASAYVMRNSGDNMKKIWIGNNMADLNNNILEYSTKMKHIYLPSGDSFAN